MTGAQLSTVKAALRSKKTAKKAKEKAAETAALTTSILATLTGAGYVVKPEQKSEDQKPAPKKKTKTPASPKPQGDTETEDGDDEESEAAPTPEKKKKLSRLDKVKAKLDSSNETVAQLRAVLAEVVDSSPIAGINAYSDDDMAGGSPAKRTRQSKLLLARRAKALLDGGSAGNIIQLRANCFTVVGALVPT